MQNDSIEGLLLRHYGNSAPAPTDLEGRLRASVRLEAETLRKHQLDVARLERKRMSRRQAFRFMARGASSAGLSALSIGLDSLQKLETTLVGADAPAPQPAHT
jgi:hypothetical protein